jgi:hypothetical protein
MRALNVLIDLAAIGVLAFGIYLPRYRRRDLLVSLLALNVGVLAVTAVLASTAIGLGTGFGIFGALSIVRLRSDELAQQDVAYYFASVALAILGGASIDPVWVGPSLAALIVVVMFLGDHPALFARARQQVIVVDRAITDERALVAHLEERLGAQITYFNVRKTDLVGDSTTVDVRYRIAEQRSVDRPVGAAHVARLGRGAA